MTVCFRLTQGYKKHVDESPLLTDDDSKCLFANIDEIYDFNRSVVLTVSSSSGLSHVTPEENGGKPPLISPVASPLHGRQSRA